jgi:hypothetical protein
MAKTCNPKRSPTKRAATVLKVKSKSAQHQLHRTAASPLMGERGLPKFAQSIQASLAKFAAAAYANRYVA